MPYITEQQIDAAHAAYDEEERNVNGGTINDCLRAAIQAALAQPDAEPVAWRYRYRVTKDHPWSNWMLMPSADGKELCDKYPENYETQGLGVISAPPRPDISAGLIEAAEIAEEWDSGWGEDRNTRVARQTALEIAEALRARAADRSGK